MALKSRLEILPWKMNASFMESLTSFLVKSKQINEPGSSVEAAATHGGESSIRSRKLKLLSFFCYKQKGEELEVSGHSSDIVMLKMELMQYSGRNDAAD